MGLPPPPDLILIKPPASLNGFPPWPLGLADIFVSSNDEYDSLAASDLDAAFRQFAAAEQRHGR